MSFESKLIQLLSDADKIDEASATEIYQGWHHPGSFLESAASWKIKRLSQTGTVWSIEWADGNQNYDNIWNNRASLTYSHLT
jgi:hypothetical protein